MEYITKKGKDVKGKEIFDILAEPVDIAVPLRFNEEKGKYQFTSGLTNIVGVFQPNRIPPEFLEELGDLAVTDMFTTENGKKLIALKPSEDEAIGHYSKLFGWGKDNEKLNKDAFLKSELGWKLEETALAWNMALEERERLQKSGELLDDFDLKSKLRAYGNIVRSCQDRWLVFKLMFKQFYGIEYQFKQIEEYYGICTKDETDWLFRKKR